MSRWRVEVTARSEEDLVKAATYISDTLGSPQAALRLVDEFEECVGRLASQPALRPYVRDERLARRGYRWMPVGGYMAFYTTDEASHTVYVERVLYSRSDWRALL